MLTPSRQNTLQFPFLGSLPNGKKREEKEGKREKKRKRGDNKREREEQMTNREESKGMGLVRISIFMEVNKHIPRLEARILN